MNLRLIATGILIAVLTLVVTRKAPGQSAQNRAESDGAFVASLPVTTVQESASGGRRLIDEVGPAGGSVWESTAPASELIQPASESASNIFLQDTVPGTPPANESTNRPSTPPATALAQSETGSGAFWDSVNINGHIRVRQETDWERIDQPTRNRGRLRARLAFTWTPTDEFDAGFRWTTGDRKIVLEPGDRRGAPLSYQDMGDVFDKFELNLDRIFITWKPRRIPKSFVTFGKFRFPGKLNPIFSDPIGDLVFDEAVQPEGVAAGYTWLPGGIIDELYMTAGETLFLEQGAADEASMFFMQLWAKKQRPNVTLEGGVTWFNWNNLNADGSTRISFENNFGNEVIAVGPNPEDVVFASGFSIINPLLAVTLDDRNDCNRVYPLQFIWETFYNAESFDTDRDTGYSVGFQYGPAVNRSGRAAGDWKIYYTWNKVEQESVLTPVAQDDWQRATNFRGHWIGADYFIRKNIEFRLWVLGDQPILPINSRSEIDQVGGSTQQEWRGRLDLTVYY